MSCVLLVSDTHMHFQRLERLVCAVDPVAVIHAGDLGLYDAGSWDRLSAHEQKLIVKHADPLQEAIEWTEGRRPLPVPLLGVSGNHEDYTVVRAIEAGTRRVPGFTLLCAGARHPLAACGRLLSIMGFGRVLPDNVVPSPTLPEPTLRPVDVEAMEAAWTGEPPDVLVVHEPPRLVGPRGRFGSDVVLRLVQLFEPRLVVAGHMHIPYRVQVGPSLVVGLGYGVRGCHALLHEDLSVEHVSLDGRPVRLEEVHLD